MTREETAVIIGNIPINEGDDCYTIAEYQEAKAMAIKALEQESCDDCISRQAALEKAINIPIAKVVPEDEVIYRKIIFADDIEKLSPVTPQPKIGKWKREEFPNFTSWFCNKCGRGWRHKFDRCPNCLAKMEGEEQNGKR